MKVKISPSVIFGKVKAPPSKSMAHRLLICAGLAKGKSRIDSVAYSEDILATLDCLEEMGADIVKENGYVIIEGTSPALKSSHLFSCRESGSTLRFFVPILMHSAVEQTFTGYGRLMQRPMDIYEKLAKENGMYYLADGEKISLRGVLKGGEFAVKGNISSQFISGLLFSLPLCKNDSTIRLLPPVESKSYIDMTIDAMAAFGVEAVWKDETTLFIKGNQDYVPRNISVEGDFSNAAFPDAFNYLGGSLEVSGLSETSLQGDRIYKDYFKKLEDGTPVLDVSNCPDLAPVLMTLAVLKNGATFTGTKRLSIKESDRAQTMKQELSNFGADITVNENSVIIKKALLHSSERPLYAHNDHRVAMSLAVICSVFGGIIEGAECVKKSYPDFFEVMQKVGLEVKIYDN